MKYDFRKRSDDALIYNTEPSRTKPEFASACDINNILKKYAKNGVNPFLLTASARFGDFSDVPSYQEALNLVQSADDHFMSLPATLRARFSNDPAKLLDFINNPSNLDEAVDLGLLALSVDKSEIGESRRNLAALKASRNKKEEISS